MIEQLKSIIKSISNKLGVHLTKNQAYDAQLEKVIESICAANKNANTIDVGAHKGEIADLFNQYAPLGRHLLFEPIPQMNQDLQEKYKNHTNIKVFDIALSHSAGEKRFHHNQTNPAYSGIEKREYPSENDAVQKIKVTTNTLDAILVTEESLPIHIIKIDVEGGELGVLQGAKKTIEAHKPTIIFEHGLGASEFYDTTPELVYDYIDSLGMRISLMKNWLQNDHHYFSKEDFCKEFYDKLNYYFIAFTKA